jgi:hypothetical protein
MNYAHLVILEWIKLYKVRWKPCEVILEWIKLYKVRWKPWGLSGSPAIIINPPAWCGATMTLCAGDVETPFLGGEAP